MVNDQLIRQFASQYNFLTIDIINKLTPLFGSINDKEYCRGLIAGYAHSREIISNNENNQQSLLTIGSILCFVSNRYMELS